MDPTISAVPAAEEKVAAFYDSLAPDYDAMTGFRKRFVKERPFFRLLVTRYGITTALDAGSGSGFHSLLLASLGVQVTAVDVSPKMIELLRTHAQEMGVTVRALESTFLALPLEVQEKLDAVFCMGNVLAHVLRRSELSDTFSAFARVLKPGGLLFFQNLNYDRILARRESVQSINESETTTYVRYYEYEEDTIRFHILKVKKEGTGVTHELNSTTLRPIVRNELLQLLPEAGFDDIRLFGGITMEEFQEQASKDLVILATKRG